MRPHAACGSSETGYRMGERGHRAIDKVGSIAQHAAERTGAHSAEWMARQDEMTGQVREYIREHPFVALAMAAGVSVCALPAGRRWTGTRAISGVVDTVRPPEDWDGN